MGDLRGTYLTTAPNVSEQMAHAAAVTVVEHSRDEADVRLLLFSLGLVEACEGVENPPQACGHPASSRRRRSTGKGFQCDECLRAGARVRHARERARRVTAS